MSIACIFGEFAVEVALITAWRIQEAAGQLNRLRMWKEVRVSDVDMAHTVRLVGCTVRGAGSSGLSRRYNTARHLLFSDEHNPHTVRRWLKPLASV